MGDEDEEIKEDGEFKIGEEGDEIPPEDLLVEDFGIEDPEDSFH